MVNLTLPMASSSEAEAEEVSMSGQDAFATGEISHTGMEGRLQDSDAVILHRHSIISI